MADEGTSSTLVIIGAVLQLIFFFLLAAGTGIVAMALTFLPSIPPSALPPEFPPIDVLIGMMYGYVILLAVMTVFALIFSILWFMWRGSPSQHKAGLIITGILALIFSGFLPGLLVLIGGAISPSESTSVTTTVTTPKVSPPESKPGVKYCAACGNPVNPDAQFCGICGANVV
ncbi:MAG: zinc ribbon domain-containing protein [Candidatus Hermodarchaeia archaeon]